MADAGVCAHDVDVLIVNTLSPDHHDPSQACYLLARLGLREIPFFDILAQCSGGLYGIQIARYFLASGLYRNVLLICAEALSRRIDASLAVRNLSVLLSDGDAVLLLKSSPDPTVGLMDLILGARRHAVRPSVHEGAGRAASTLHRCCRLGRRPASVPDARCGHVRRCDAPDRRRVLFQMLDWHALTISDIGLVVPHQPNLRILDHVIAQLGLPRERCVVSVDKLGKMASAAFPIALAIAYEQERLATGQLNLLVIMGLVRPGPARFTGAERSAARHTRLDRF